MSEREMTLVEWLGRLPDCHLAWKQYREIKARARIAEQEKRELLEALRNARSVTRSIGIAVRGELPSMASDAAHCANQIDALLAKYEQEATHDR